MELKQLQRSQKIIGCTGIVALLILWGFGLISLAEVFWVELFLVGMLVFIHPAWAVGLSVVWYGFLYCAQNYPPGDFYIRLDENLSLVTAIFSALNAIFQGCLAIFYLAGTIIIGLVIILAAYMLSCMVKLIILMLKK